jgi:hypothetical protein
MENSAPNNPLKDELLKRLSEKSETVLISLLQIAKEFNEIELTTISQKIKSPLNKAKIKMFL